MRYFKFNISGNNYEVDILKLEGNLAEVDVNGTVYQVEIERKKVESKTPILIRSTISNSVMAGGVKLSAGEKNALLKVIAPLPGVIMSIHVKEGDAVKRGYKMMVYEAMKMENNLLAEKDGVVKSIKVQVGDNVLQGDLLIEME